MWTHEPNDVWTKAEEGFICVAYPSAQAWQGHVLRADTGATVMMTRSDSDQVARLDCDAWLRAYRALKERDPKSLAEERDPYPRG